MDNPNFTIDLVYLWVDGNDPKWLAKYNSFIGNSEGTGEIDCKGRYANNDELKYSLRSVEKHAPWIRTIFIVTYDQTPDWIDATHPKIKIVHHKDIMPEACLPCFNPSVVEYFLHKIPDLSEHFLYANDDMFFCADVQPDFFFARDGFPIVRLKRKPLGKLHYWGKFLTGKKPGRQRTVVYKASSLVEKKFGKYYFGIPHHNIDAYLKSDLRAIIEDVFREEVEKSFFNRIRTSDDFERSIFSYYALAVGHGHLRYTRREETIRVPVYKPDFMKYLHRYQPKLLCLNDCQHTTDNDRERIKPFLETLFPEKAAFEK